MITRHEQSNLIPDMTESPPRLRAGRLSKIAAGVMLVGALSGCASNSPVDLEARSIAIEQNVDWSLIRVGGSRKAAFQPSWLVEADGLEIVLVSVENDGLAAVGNHDRGAVRRKQRPKSEAGRDRGTFGKRLWTSSDVTGFT